MHENYSPGYQDDAAASVSMETDLDRSNESDVIVFDDGSHGNGTSSSSFGRGPEASRPEASRPEMLTVVLVLVYLSICVVGLIGNSLVVAVVARFAKMKTVTNVYILNLSIADALYLAGLPMVSTTAVLRYWVFGPVLCKVYYVLTSINMFTGTFTLTLMSADRFVAVWYPIKSLRFRATKFASLEVILIWIVSIAVMFPIVLYASHVPQPTMIRGGNSSSLSPNPTIRYSCQVLWPAEQPISAIRTYTVYTFVIGFLVPVALISVFYLQLVMRLRSNRLNLRSGTERRGRPRRSVTTLVTIIISVFIFCWLPYWVFQVQLVFGKVGPLPRWAVYLFLILTVLTYLNSAVNPLLYAFTNDSFKKAFVAACRCGRLKPGSSSEMRSDIGQIRDPTTTVSRCGVRDTKGGETGPSISKRRMTRSQATVLCEISGSVAQEKAPSKTTGPLCTGQERELVGENIVSCEGTSLQNCATLI